MTFEKLCDVETEENPSEENDHDMPTVAPRRSTRTTRQPQWMTSNEYVMSQTVQSDWKEKVNFLVSLTDKQEFSFTNKQICDAIITVITNK